MTTTKSSSTFARLLLVPPGMLVGLLIVEALLRIFQPFHFRLKGDKLDLWPGRQYVIQLDEPHGLDTVVTTRHNAIGLRGPEPPADLDQHLTIVTVGGSTTEGNLLSEGKTWPDQLAGQLSRHFDRVWVNNAGISGQTTFGHQIMMEDHVIPLKPKVVLFLIGINDVGLGAPKKQVDARPAGFDMSSSQALANSLARHSEVAGLGLNLLRFAKAKQRRLADTREFQLEKVAALTRPMPDSAKARHRAEHQAQHLPYYEERVRRLVTLARAASIEPVLITQPILFGYLKDDVTGIDLGKLDWEHESGFRWELLEMYNDVVRRVGQNDTVLVIDLARKLPKSWRFFYDEAHFTNDGAQRVGLILAHDLCPWLTDRFPTFATGQCAVTEPDPTPNVRPVPASASAGAPQTEAGRR